MDQTTCTTSGLICKTGFVLLALLAAWLYLAHFEHAVWPGKCTGVNMKVDKGQVVATQLQGNTLALTVTFPDQKVTKVIVYDYCKGQVLNSVEAAW
jgi:hypothetical protein